MPLPWLLSCSLNISCSTMLGAMQKLWDDKWRSGWCWVMRRTDPDTIQVRREILEDWDVDLGWQPQKNRVHNVYYVLWLQSLISLPRLIWLPQHGYINYNHQVKEEKEINRCLGGQRFVAKAKNDLFKSRQEGLKRFTFECNRPEHAAQFAITLKELFLSVEKGYKSGEDIGQSFWGINEGYITCKTSARCWPV